ncbi:TIGR01777 family oxidoreductase [Leeuwenhoekiella sp. A2]|uniref:TIGR01777 family oxidoreductase n=1 Tax=Leeuwenhoekiella sp. A2 TaxID=3141460 RepID=UPI003A7F8588
MRVLITGATGLVGNAVTALCLDQNIEVNYLTTSQEKIKTEINYKGFLWNPEMQTIDKRAFDGVDVIIHLAGASIAQRWTDTHKKEIVASRVNTANLLFKTLASIDHTIAKFISASAIGAYPSSYTHYYKEDYPDYNAGFLGEVVEKWEQAADQFAAINIDVVKIRVGVVLAKDGGALQQLIKPIKYYAGAPLGTGEQWQSWIHIADLAGIFVFCIKNKVSGTFNAVAPNAVTNEGLTKVAAKKMGKPLFLPNVPAFALKAALGEMADVVLESQRVSSEHIQNEGYNFQFAYIEEALENLLK